MRAIVTGEMIYKSFEEWRRIREYWAKNYLEPVKSDLILKDGYGGLNCEQLSVEAIRACLSGTEKDVQAFLNNITAFRSPYVGGNLYQAELFDGRSGTRYMLQMVKCFALM